MRTLTRPMFNMGGPIKQGIMHGIREPYAHGTRAALVGNPVFPKTGGREHHFVAAAVPAIWANVARLLGGQAVKKGITSLSQGQLFKKGIQESVKKAAGAGGASNIAKAAAGEGYWARDPTFKALKWAKDAIMSPTAKGWGKSAVRGLTSPTGLALTAASTYGMWPDGTPKGPPTGIEKPGGYPPGPTEPKAKVLSDAERDAFALAERNKRVKKYLDLMGYDRSKKTAIADALIDASKIVGERGTLDPKNITQELINPIIQATSKRLDKPDQIREAVGLMATKAAIEKDLEDPSIKALRLKQLEAADREALKDTVGGDIRAYNTKHGKLPVGTNLAQIVRLRGGEVAGVPNTTEVKKWMKANETDEVGFLEELIKTTKVAPGTYVVNNQILIVDENSIVQPYTY